MKKAVASLACSALFLAGTAFLAVPTFAGRRVVEQAGSVLATGSTLTIATAGDIARSGGPATPQKQTAALITDRIHPQLVLELGDAQYEHGELAQFMKSYDPTWGAFKNITAPILGNHEYETSGASGYFAYFKAQLSTRGAKASDPKAGYYSFDQGGWHIVGLNSNCSFASCSAQATWLKQDLAADSHLCELVFYHDPSVSAFTKAVAAGGAEFVLSGHLHRYERWNNYRGFNIRQFIVGTGGRSSGTPNPGADAEAKAYGVARLDLSASGYTWQFIDVGGRVRDSGSDTCSA